MKKKNQNIRTYMNKYKHGPPQAILLSDWSIKKKSPPLKPLDQISRNMTGSIYGMSSMKTAHFVPIG
jgi:hypothetical protein